jgi:hypothetical protein
MKKKGRPKKNKNLNLGDPINDINTKNLYPPNTIVLDKLANIIVNDKELDHTVYASCDKPAMFATLLECIKGKDTYINIMFDKTGFIFTQADNTHKEMIKYECKIFPDKLIKYDISVDREVVKIELDLLIKTLKCIPKDNIVIFLVYSSEDKRTFRIVNRYKNPKISKYTDTIINITGVLGYTPITCKKTDNRYDVIYKQEAAEFHKNCVMINKFSKTFNIICSNYTENTYMLDYNYGQGNMQSFIRNPPSENFMYVTLPSNTVKSTFNITAILKPSKLHKISPVVKIYLSNTEPLIIEYTIGDGIGLMQIFCSQHNKIQ